MGKDKELIRQLEYYLSDNNLKSDQFFYDQISADKDLFIDIKCFLNCNKVKKMGVMQVSQIVNAVENQQNNLELNADKTMVRRKGMNQLPEFMAKKKVKIDENKDEKNGEDHTVNPYNSLETSIFTLKLDKDQTVPFRYIQEALLKNFNVYSPYVRFNKNEGNFAIEKKLCTEQLINKFQQGLKVGETVLKVKKTQGQQLDQFWQKHGFHYNSIIDNLKKQHDKNHKAERKGARLGHGHKKISDFQFGGQKYNDINQIKSLFKNILCRNPNNKPLPAKESQLVKQLLRYHTNAEQKMKDFKHFVVDVNPNYVDTRCLFVVRNDGTRDDFSIVKCIENLQNKLEA